MAIAVDQNYDKSQRKISTANLEQFAGVDCQLLVEKETHRPIIMDGATVGGNFKCASTDELEAVKAKADSAVSADSVQWEGVEGVPDNVANALAFIAQSLTSEQKAQVVQNLMGTFLPLSGGTVNGDVSVNGSLQNNGVNVVTPYKAEDTIAVSFAEYVPGVITGSGKTLSFTIPLCRPIVASSITTNRLIISVRLDGQYINSNDSSGEDVTSKITNCAVGAFGIRINVDKSEGWNSAQNNNSVVISIGSGSSFTFK